MALTFPNIDPVIFHIAGPLAVRWYSLAYIGGILGGGLYIRYLNQFAPKVFNQKTLDDIIVWLVLSIIIGGRLGYIMFYKPDQYLNAPLLILKTWEGGMSFHGGAIGLLVGVYLFCRKNGLQFLQAMDLIAAATPIGLLLGRLGNFINGELYGRPTNVPWAMVFPEGGYLARHPSQIYEAILEGLLLFLILFFASTKTNARKKSGLIFGLFCFGYGISRIFAEYFREPDIHLGFLFANVTMGQLLSLPMLMLGIYMMLRSPDNRLINP